jgi:hypothetical protein
VTSSANSAFRVRLVAAACTHPAWRRTIWVNASCDPLPYERKSSVSSSIKSVTSPQHAVPTSNRTTMPPIAQLPGKKRATTLTSIRPNHPHFRPAIPTSPQNARKNAQRRRIDRGRRFPSRHTLKTAMRGGESGTFHSGTGFQPVQDAHGLKTRATQND